MRVYFGSVRHHLLRRRASAEFVGGAALRTRFADWFATFDGGLEIETREVRIDAHDSLCFAAMLTHASGALKNGQRMAHWVRVTVCCRRLEGWAIAHEHVSLPMDVGRRRETQASR